MVSQSVIYLSLLGMISPSFLPHLCEDLCLLRQSVLLTLTNSHVMSLKAIKSILYEKQAIKLVVYAFKADTMASNIDPGKKHNVSVFIYLLHQIENENIYWYFLQEISNVLLSIIFLHFLYNAILILKATPPLFQRKHGLIRKVMSANMFSIHMYVVVMQPF